MLNKLRKIIICILFLSVCTISFSQNIEDNLIVRSYLDEVFQNIDKSRVPMGLLRDYALELIDFDAFDGTVLTDSNYVDSSTFEMILRSIRSSSVTDEPFTDVATMMSSLVTTTDVIPIAIALYKYNYIRENAIESGLIRVVNDKAYDVYSSAGVWQNPYGEKFIFAMSPLAELSRDNTVVFSFSEPFTNVEVSRIEFDSGDGLGYQDVTTLSTLTVIYPSNGQYSLNMRITLPTGQVVLSHSSLYISEPFPPTRTPVDDNTITIDTTYNGINVKARVRIAHNTSTNKLERPFIVVEGFDPLYDDGYSSKVYYLDGSSIFDYNSIPLGYRSLYDFIYVDWENSEKDIMANAALLEKIIRYINQEKAKNGSSESNIILGQSLGGVISRIALRTMELNGVPHETSVYISHDSPHLGANVPIGLLYTARDLLNFWITDLDVWAYLASHFLENIIALRAAVWDFHDLMNSQAVRQILVNYVDENGQLDNTCHNSFINKLNSLGFPEGDSGKPITKLAICLSGDRGLRFEPNAKLLYYDDALLNSLLAYAVYLFIGKENMKFFRGMGKNCQLRMKVDVRPFVANCSLLSELSITYHKKILGINKSFTILSKQHESPLTGPQYDILPSSLYDVSAVLREFDLGSFLGPNSLSVVEEFAFIPTASALCFKSGNLSVSDYMSDFVMSPPALSTDIPFDAVRFSQMPTYHSFGYETVSDDIDWIMANLHLELDGSLLPKNGEVYSVRNCIYPIEWRTSNSNVATIDNAGRLSVVSSGFTYVEAIVQTPNGRRFLRKRVMVGFPPFVLTSNKNNFMGSTSYWIMANTVEDEFFDFIKKCNLTAHWGIKYSNEPNIIWSEELLSYADSPMETTSFADIVVSFSGHNDSTSALVAFYVDGSNGESETYVIPIVNSSSSGALPGGGVIITSDGNILDLSCDEIVSAETKSVISDYYLLVDDLDVCVQFNHWPSNREITTSLLQNEMFNRELKLMKPWGNETFLVKKIKLRKGSDEFVGVAPFVIMFKDDL